MNGSGVIGIMSERGCTEMQQPSHNHHIGGATEVQEIPEFQGVLPIRIFQHKQKGLGFRSSSRVTSRFTKKGINIQQLHNF